MTKRSGKVRERPLRSDAIPRAEIVRLRLVRMSAAEIAEELGAKPDTISGILQEPEVVAAIEAAEKSALEDAKQGLTNGARRAMQKLVQLVEHPDPKIALDASKLLITASGAHAPAKTQNEHTGANGAPLLPTPVQAREQLAARIAAMPEDQREAAKKLLGEEWMQ